MVFSKFQNCTHCNKVLKDNINMVASIWGENMLGYLSLDIICSSKLTVFLELRSWKTACFSEQIMSVTPNGGYCLYILHLAKNMLGYMSLDIICSLKLTVFLELCLQKTVCFLSTDRYPSMSPYQMEATVYM